MVARAEKSSFLVKTFQKVPKMFVFGLFFQNFEIFVDLFFRSTKLTFRALFWPNFLRRSQNSEKQAFLGTFWKISTKNRVFTARAPPSKLEYSGAKGASRKFSGSVTKCGYPRIVQRGDTLGRQGVESLRGGEGVQYPILQSPPPKSAPEST